MTLHRALFLALLTIGIHTPSLFAGGTFAQIDATTASGLPGSSVQITFSVTHDNLGGLSGVSFGVEHDPTVVSIASAAQIVEAPALANGAGLASADFFTPSLTTDGGVGFTLGVVVDFIQNDLVPPGTYDVAVVTYDILPGAAGGTTPLQFTSALGSPPTEAVVVVIDPVSGLTSLTPTMVNGSITVIGLAGTSYIRGDGNGDQNVSIADAMDTLLVLFGGGSTTCLDAHDTDDDGTVNLTDPILLLYFLFAPAPPITLTLQCDDDPAVMDCPISTCVAL